MKDLYDANSYGVLGFSVKTCVRLIIITIAITNLKVSFDILAGLLH